MQSLHYGYIIVKTFELHMLRGENAQVQEILDALEPFLAPKYGNFLLSPPYYRYKSLLLWNQGKFEKHLP